MTSNYSVEQIAGFKLSGDNRNALRAEVTKENTARAGGYVTRDLVKSVDLMVAAQELGIDLARFVAVAPTEVTPEQAPADTWTMATEVVESKPLGLSEAIDAERDAREALGVAEAQLLALPEGLPDSVSQGMVDAVEELRAKLVLAGRAKQEASERCKAKAKASKAQASSVPAPVGNIEFQPVSKVLGLRHKALKSVYLPVFKGQRHDAVPALDMDFFFNYEQGEIVRDIAISLGAVYDSDYRKHVQSNLWLWGAKGAGKSELIAQIASRCNRPMFVTSCHRELTVESLTGDFDPRSVAQGADAPALLNPAFIQGISCPHAIVVLDETGRVNPVNAVGFNGMLERRQATRQDGTIVDFAEGVSIVSTCNSNGTGDPTGLFECYSQDQSFLDRFRAFVKLPFLPAEEESAVLARKSGICQPVADLLVKVLNSFRGASEGEDASVQARGLYPSLRGAGNVAERLLKGIPFRRALATCLTGNVTLSDVEVAKVIIEAHCPSDEEIAKVVSGELTEFVQPEEESAEGAEGESTDENNESGD